jgi:hypothetical protein
LRFGRVAVKEQSFNILTENGPANAVDGVETPFQAIDDHELLCCMRRSILEIREAGRSFEAIAFARNAIAFLDRLQIDRSAD